MNNTEIAQKLQKALDEAEKIEGEVEAYSVVRAYAYLEAHIEGIIEELEGDPKDSWEEVIELAEEYGFIWYCYAGVAILITPEERERRKEELN